MFRIPKWLQKSFKVNDYSCPTCSAEFDSDEIILIGIKNAAWKEGKSKEMLFIERVCGGCKKKIGYQIYDLTLEDFAMAVLQGIVEDDVEEQDAAEDEEMRRAIEEEVSKLKFNTDPMKKAKAKLESKISLAEQKRAVEMLNDAESWADWLIQIGVPIENVENNKQFDIDDDETDSDE